MTTPQQRNFVKSVFDAANSAYQQAPNDSISPLFITAQAILESGWGQSAIGNNLFGITKGSSWTGKTKLVLTTEYFKTRNKIFTRPERIDSISTADGGLFKYKVWRLFRDYDSIADCLQDHLKILRKPIYQDAWDYRNDPVEFARRISDNVGAKYATAPNYADTIRTIINQIKPIIKP